MNEQKWSDAQANFCFYDFAVECFTSCILFSAGSRGPIQPRPLTRVPFVTSFCSCYFLDSYFFTTCQISLSGCLCASASRNLFFRATVLFHKAHILRAQCAYSQVFALCIKLSSVFRLIKLRLFRRLRFFAISCGWWCGFCRGAAYLIEALND